MNKNGKTCFSYNFGLIRRKAFLDTQWPWKVNVADVMIMGTVNSKPLVLTTS